MGYKKAIEIDPRFAEAHYHLALIYFEKGEFQLAIGHVDQAGKLGISVDPKFLESLRPYR